MTEFKQIIGRGTRVREDYGKLFFTILDYTGAATQNFADPEFDGEPARATVEKMDEQGETETTSDVEEPLDVQEAQDETPPEEVIYVVEPARLLQTRERQEPRKYYLTNGVEVRIIDEVEAALDASGRKLRTVQLTTYTGEQVNSHVRDPDALRRSWAHADERERIVAALEERGITLEHLAAVMDQPDADPFDLLCHLAFSAPLRKRSERAEQVRKEKRDFFARYAPEARDILEELLDQYAAFGPSQFILPDMLRLPVIERHGNVGEIAALFGGADQLREAVTELQELLYAA